MAYVHEFQMGKVSRSTKESEKSSVGLGIPEKVARPGPWFLRL